LADQIATAPGENGEPGCVRTKSGANDEFRPGPAVHRGCAMKAATRPVLSAKPLDADATSCGRDSHLQQVVADRLVADRVAPSIAVDISAGHYSAGYPSV
jgi:hypothetical protein